MLNFAMPLILLLTYSEMYLKKHEMQAVYPFNATRVHPADAGEMRLAETVLETPDAERLILWTAPPRPGAPTILYLPGNAGNLARRTARFSDFLDQGYGVVAVGYRGSSGSSGSPSEVNISADALLIFDAIGGLTGVQDGPVIIFGESLGTAVAAKIAVARGAHALVLEAPFTSIPDLAQVQYPDIDLSKVLTQLWDTSMIIGDVDEPLLVLHGTADVLVPFEQGQTVFRLAGSQQKWLHALQGVGHQGTWTPEAMNAFYEFLERL